MPRSIWISEALAGGWEADDPVWAGDVDRMFVSLVAGLSGADEMLAAPAEGWAELGDRLRRIGIGAGDRRRSGAGARLADRDGL